MNSLRVSSYIVVNALVCCYLAFAAVAGAQDAAQRRPNVLFLRADDQRRDTIAAYGNPHIETPNLDRLVSEGFSFRQAYCR